MRLLSLPGQFWKWRMHGAAPRLAMDFHAEREVADLLLATDLLDCATFLALIREGRRVPLIAYFHENQLTYPLPQDPAVGPMRRQRGERDLHYAWINYTTLLAADCAIWNSAYHLDQFFGELPRMLRHFPDEISGLPTDALKSKCEVLAPGIDRLPGGVTRSYAGKSPLILWNHRWEYDKDPATFFDALFALRGEGVPFRLAICGENQRQCPQEFDAAREVLGDRVEHFGFAEPVRYRQLLSDADIVVSTALHDFFGLSVVEAVAHGAFPVLPRRLAYPEIVPREHHGHCLYDGPNGLRERLRWVIEHGEERAQVATKLAAAMMEFEWGTLALRYDALFERVFESSVR